MADLAAIQRGDRSALALIAEAEQMRQVRSYKARIARLDDPAERDRQTAQMHRADRAWAHVVLWLKDPSQPPEAADQTGIHRAVRATVDMVRRAWAREADQTSAHPNAPHWIGLFEIERAISRRWFYIEDGSVRHA